MEIIDVKHSHFAPFHFRIFGGILIVFGLLLPVQIGNFLALLIFSGGSIVVGLLLITTRYGIQINPASCSYKEYVNVLGMARGNWHAYGTIEKIFINARKTSQRMTSRGNYRTDIINTEYIAYLKFEDGIKVQLDEDASKPKLLARIERYNQLLNTIVADNT